MDVKSVFLNGYITEEFHVHQPPGFENHKNIDFVYKLKKSLYGMKQALRAWYEILDNFLLENIFSRGKLDTTLFCKTFKNYLLIVQIFIYDIEKKIGYNLEIYIDDITVKMLEGGIHAADLENISISVGNYNMLIWCADGKVLEIFAHQAGHKGEYL